MVEKFDHLASLQRLQIPTNEETYLEALEYEVAKIKSLYKRRRIQEERSERENLLLERAKEVSEGDMIDHFWFIRDGDNRPVGIDVEDMEVTIFVRGNHAVDCDYHTIPESQEMADWVHSVKGIEDHPRFSLLKTIEGPFDESFDESDLDGLSYEEEDVASGMWSGTVIVWILSKKK